MMLLSDHTHPVGPVTTKICDDGDASEIGHAVSNRSEHRTSPILRDQILTKGSDDTVMTMLPMLGRMCPTG